MIGKWCDLMLRRAARRWPDDTSAEMLTEWRAELQALPSRRSRLWFTFSLATARPHRTSVLTPGGTLTNRLKLSTILAIALTPLAASGFVYAVRNVAFWASYKMAAYNMASDVMTIIALAVLLAIGTATLTWWGIRRGRSATMRGPAAVAILTGSVAMASLWMPGLVSGRDAMRIAMPAVLVWTPLMALALTIAISLARADRPAWAWVVGATAALLFADLAIVAQVYSVLPADTVSWSQAASGLVQHLTTWHFSIGLSTETLPRNEGDVITSYSFGGGLGPIMLLCSAFALAFAIEAARAKATPTAHDLAKPD